MAPRPVPPAGCEDALASSRASQRRRGKHSSCSGMNSPEPPGHRRLAFHPSPSPFIFLIPRVSWALPRSLARPPQALEKHKRRYQPVVALLR